MNQRLTNLIFTALFVLIVGMLGWLSSRHTQLYDWTANARNSLSQASLEILEQMPDPIEVIAFAREDETLRQAITRLVARYQRAAPQLTFRFINPDLAPDLIREKGITTNGECLISYQGRTEKIGQVHEQSFSNALLRLSRSEQRHILFLSGHGERAPQILKQGGVANFDLGVFSSELERSGLQLSRLNLATTPSIPEQTSVLIIANPRTQLLPGEIGLITAYINQGGNLLWLAEPGHPLPSPIAEALNTQTQPGVVVDSNSPLFGIDDPSFALVTEYAASNPVSASLRAVTVYPTASIVDRQDPSALTDWRHQELLRTLPRSWAEHDEIKGEISYDPNTERLGPLPIGLTQTRVHPTGEGEQRVAVIGDADFLSNTYLGNGGNLDLGLALINWLSHDDHLIQIPTKTAPDRQLELSPLMSGVIGFGFLLILPGLLLAAGVWIWLRRKRR